MTEGDAVTVQPGAYTGKVAPAPVLSSDPVRSWEDFAAVRERVETAAREWGLRPNHPEGQFVSALMGAIEWTGRVIETARADFKDTAALELARAKQITKAAEAALGQARTAQIALQCEQENLVYRMMKEVMPLFVTKLCETLAQREKTWNGGLRPRRYVVTGLLTLGLFLGGYAVCAWQVRGATSFLGQCMAHQVSANGRTYCEMTGFAQVAQ